MSQNFQNIPWAWEKGRHIKLRSVGDLVVFRVFDCFVNFLVFLC